MTSVITRVIKIGGRAQDDPSLPGAVAGLARRGDARLSIVHGGGDEISALQRRLGGSPSFVGGRRVTTRDDIEIVRMALSGTANKRLVSRLLTAGVRAVGLSGEDAGLVVARRRDDGALGEVGEPVAVDGALLELLMGRGYVPVISPVSRADEDGGALNVNGDDAAAAIAAAVGADELLLVSDVAAVLENGIAVPSLDLDAARALIESGVAAGGMAAKLEAARAALEGGVGRVRIGNLDMLHAPESGTTILKSAGSASGRF